MDSSSEYSFIRFLLAWAFLNIFINLNFPAGEPFLLAPLLPSADIAGLMLIVCAAVWLGMPFRFAFYLPLAAFIVFLRLFRIGDVLIPFYFNRNFDMYIDSRYVPDLFHLLFNTTSPVGFIGYCLLGLVFFALILWGIWKSFATIHYFFTEKRHRMIFAVLFSAFLGLSLLWPDNKNGRQIKVFRRASFLRVAEEINYIFQAPQLHKQYAAIIRETAESQDRISASLDKLAGTNVFLFLIESYGHTVFANQRHLALVNPVMAQFERDLRDNGFWVYSNFLNAPTYGGASWLTHGTIASGIRIDNQMLYDLLLSSRIKPLAGYFSAAGYRTVGVMPGTTWFWPQGEFFGFHKAYYARDFDYQGPRYGWSAMPDQYVLDYIFRNEIRSHSQPMFIQFILISSHVPFHIHPPYLADWSKIGAGRIYHLREPILFSVKWPDLTNASEAYMSSIIYDLQVLRAFIVQLISDQTLVIIMGDHQPNVQITGEGCPWSVPVHVISRSRKLLHPFALRGYTPGLAPRQPPPHAGMQTFLKNFLDDFSITK